MARVAQNFFGVRFSVGMRMQKKLFPVVAATLLLAGCGSSPSEDGAAYGKELAQSREDNAEVWASCISEATSRYDAKADQDAFSDACHEASGVDFGDW